MKKKILITAALPYANGALHFGHIAGAYLPADAFARFQRLKGNDVLFISGSDEYGVAITLNAELLGRTPKEHVDEFHEVNRRFFESLHISFDHFSRTTCEEHAPLVQGFFLDLLKNGYVEKRKTLQLYSEKDHRFLADRYVVGTCPKCGFEEARGDECPKCGSSFDATDLKLPRSKLTGAPLVLKETEHWFMRFDQFKEALGQFLDAHPSWKPHVTNFAMSYVENLQPRPITRDLEWGVPVPLKEAKGKVFYVWFDAPIGYISATQDWAKKSGNPEAWKQYWLDPQTKYVQFMGKDNIPFHAVFFPAMILGQSVPYKQVDDLVANEFYNLEGRRFSKSDKWVIDLEDFFKKYHVDQIRYAIAANAPETGDAEFTWKDFQMRCNAELLGKYGNFANRVLVFIQNHTAGKVPAREALEDEDHRFLNEMARLIGEIEECYESYKLRRASQLVMELATLGNSYFDAKAPWKAVKETRLRPSAMTTLALCLECLKLLALAAFPLIPDAASKLFAMLGFAKELQAFRWDEIIKMPLVAGLPLPKPSILFHKIEDTLITQEIEKLVTHEKKAEELKEGPYAPLKPEISLEDFAKVDLRVGLILKAEKLPKSKKLLKLEIDLGLEKRTVLSGISHHYTPEELIGKKVVVVANLKSAQLMGVESQGMVLAASSNSVLELAMIKDLPAGSEIS